MELIKRCWKGEEKLWKVYWLYGVVGSILIQLLFGVLGMVLPLFAKLGMVGYLAYCVWLLVSQWRCAWNCSWKGWGYIVRGIIVLVPVGILIGGLTKGGELLRVAECKSALSKTAKLSGVDPEQYYDQHKAECVKLDKVDEGKPVLPVHAPLGGAESGALAPAAPGVVPVSPAVPAGGVPTPAISAPAAIGSAPMAPVPAPAMDACEQKMADYASANHADPKAYVAANQAYLAQCRAAMQPAAAKP